MNPLVTPQLNAASLYTSMVTAVSITEPVATTTDPLTSASRPGTHSVSTNGTGVADCTAAAPYRAAFNSAIIQFFGAGSNNNAGTANVYLWHKVQSTGTALWVPTLVAALSVTLGQAVGVASTPVLDTHRFVDTITESTAYTTAKEIISQANDGVASFKLDLCGAARVEVRFAKGAATSLNGLIRLF